MDDAREMVAAADDVRALADGQPEPALHADAAGVPRRGREASAPWPASTATSTSGHRVQPGRFVTAGWRTRCCSTWRSTCSTRRATSPAPSPVSVYCESYSPPWDWYAGHSAANAPVPDDGDVRLSLQRQLELRRLSDLLDRALARLWRARQRDVGRRARPAGPGRPRLPACHRSRRCASRAGRATRFAGLEVRAGRVRRVAAQRPPRHRARAARTYAASPCATPRSSQPEAGRRSPVAAGAPWP